MNDQAALRAWAEVRLDMDPGSFAPDAVALGVIAEGADDPEAVILYNAHYGHYLSMHVASNGRARWLSRRMLAVIFRYAFEHRGVVRINAVVRQRDVKTQMMCLKLGFRAEATIRCGADDGTNGILFGMLRPECPWIATTEGQADG